MTGKRYLGSMVARNRRALALYRYNARGYGLSEGEGTPLSIETFVADIEAVIEAAKLDRFAL